MYLSVCERERGGRREKEGGSLRSREKSGVGLYRGGRGHKTLYVTVGPGMEK